MAIILLHFWMPLKFPDVIPSFCCLASWRLASIFRTAMSLLRVLFLCFLGYSVSPHHFLRDCKSESTCKASGFSAAFLALSAPIAARGTEPPVTDSAGIPAVNLQLLRRGVEGFQFRNNLRPRMERNNWIRKRVCLGRMEDFSVHRKFTHLVLHNQSFVSYILQNWHQIPLGSVAFLFF